MNGVPPPIAYAGEFGFSGQVARRLRALRELRRRRTAGGNPALSDWTDEQPEPAPRRRKPAKTAPCPASAAS